MNENKKNTVKESEDIFRDILQNADFNNLYSARDDYYLETIQELLDSNKITLELLLTHYMAFVRRRDVPQFLAYYELFKKVMVLPGSIAEVGVFIGNGLFTWAKLMETFLPGHRGRNVYGFDNFAGYTQELSTIDKAGVESTEKRFVNQFKTANGEQIKKDVFRIDEDVVKKLVEISNLDNFLMGVKRVSLYCGELEDSFKKFKEEESGVRLCLVVVDVNLYKPTMTALNFLYDLVVPDGYILLRGYGVKPWESESAAVDEFIAAHKCDLSLEDLFPFCQYPGIIMKKTVLGRK